MTPLKVNETVCSELHGVTVSLAVTDVGYALMAAAWAITPHSETAMVTLHRALSTDLDSITTDYNTLSEYYKATHEFTDAEIEARTHGIIS